MRVAEIMSDKVRTVNADEPLSTAVELLRRYRIRHGVVLRKREVVGVLSVLDVADVTDEEQDGLTVSDRMSSPVVTIKPSDKVRVAANRMRGRAVGCLPVVDGDGKCVGIVTTTDLLEAIGRGVERPIVKTERPTLDRRGPRPRR
jgi:CBS domain-containing protein